MESSARTRVLREPALLYLVLRHLSQRDLLRVQRVCQTWHRIISTDSRLLTIMWLHPGIPIDRVDEATTQINPLLYSVFPNIFDRCWFWDVFATVMAGRDRSSPFMDMWLFESPRVLHILTYPNASWRRMIPCFPAPDQLLVNVSGEERGKLLSRNFSNRNMQDTRPSHPPWLTFGLLYDIAECAWHQANPWRLHSIRFDFPIASLERRPHQEFVPEEAVISDKLRASAKSRAGRVRLYLHPDTRSEVERWEVHDEAVADGIRRLKETARFGFVKYNPPPPDRIFTDEFHFADALSLDEIEWDEAHEYDMPPREAPQFMRPKQRFLGIGLWKKKIRLPDPVES